ncbi:MAG: 16S rRNA (guanine(527)-N(7))-methyltransferase RsmG [Mycoplasmataceae bacterium]|nr:16S rRNA (guanine(527)-N(7))-methyltransferase RsmG [Mycoplasmataceae bacterium]
MNKVEFFELVKSFFPQTSETFFEQVEKYKVFLQEQNKITNLTRLASEEKIYGDYFFDSIIPYKEFDFGKSSVLDIGSGSGIPGVLLKLLFPQITLTIIESNNKKVDFLNKLKKVLNIEYDVKCKRAEEITANESEKFDIATSRAVARLDVLIEISTPYLKVGGILIEPKSLNGDFELSCAKNIINVLDVKLINEKKFISPTQHQEDVFYFKKTKKTPVGYPRKWKDIIKNVKEH